jgi:hypothetical protein
MFFTLQFPFADIRQFVDDNPLTIFPKILIGDSLELDEKTKKFVRFFGDSHQRGHMTDFIGRANHKPPPNGGHRAKYWEKLSNLWSDEYSYFGSQRGMLFNKLEKKRLAGGKLRYPRVLVRSLHMSCYGPENILWSPSMRIETGIYYVPIDPLNENELHEALIGFLKLPTMVPIHKNKSKASTEACTPNYQNTLKIERKLAKKDREQFAELPLIEQGSNLAHLILKATTSKCELNVHQSMIIPGAPLLCVHYFSDELKEPPTKVHWLPEALTEGVKIGFLSLHINKELGSVGTWLFELPSTNAKKQRTNVEIINQRQVIRNYTIAIMRYWSEYRTALLIAGSYSRNDFKFSEDTEGSLQKYLNRVTRFLFSEKWHGTSLTVIRNVVDAYGDSIDKEIRRLHFEGLQKMKRQVAKKALTLLNDQGRLDVFISYSQKDSDWLGYVKVALKEHKVAAFFVDTDIEIGAPWFKDIMQSIDKAIIAVLIVSDNFLSSNFIAKYELPRIKELSQRRKLEIIPIHVNGDLTKLDWLSDIQLTPPLFNAKPDLLEETKVKLMERVKGILESHAAKLA